LRGVTARKHRKVQPAQMGPDSSLQACDGVLATLGALRTEGAFCDIVFAVGSELFFAHQAVLAALSKPLHDHIVAQSKAQGSPAPELAMPPQPLEIHLENTAAHQVEALLERAYGGQTQAKDTGAEAFGLCTALGLEGQASTLSGLRSLQAKGVLCDMLLTVGSEHIPVHQVVLAAASSTLKRLIADGAKQLGVDMTVEKGHTPCNTFELELRGIKHAEAGRILVDFLYGRSMSAREMSNEVCKDVLQLASELRFPTLEAHVLRWSRGCKTKKEQTSGEAVAVAGKPEGAAEAPEAEVDDDEGDGVEEAAEEVAEETQEHEEQEDPEEADAAEAKQGPEHAGGQGPDVEKAETFLSMHCLRFNSKLPVPQQPMMGAKEAAEQAGEIYCRQDASFLEKLVRLFWERPVWLEPGLKQAPLLAKVMDVDRLKRLLPFVAYQWKDGPWQQAFVRRGWDPREEPEESLKLQVVNFKDERFPGKGREIPEAAEDVFFRRAPARRFQLYVLADIEDEFIESLVEGIEAKSECDRRTGFLEAVIHGVILNRLKVKSTELRQKRKQQGTDASRKRARAA